MSDLLNSYIYSWPHSELTEACNWSDAGSLFTQRSLPESLSELEKDSRWPLFFPSSICIVTTSDGKTTAMEKVVGPSIVNRFPYVVALSFCKKGLSDRHHNRNTFIKLLENSTGIAVQFFPPGDSLEITMSSIREVEEKYSEKRVAHTGLSVRKALTNDSPVFYSAYLIYEARLAMPGKDFYGRTTFEKPWIDLGSHRIYFFEVNALQLDEKIAEGTNQISWCSLPRWTPEIKSKTNAKKQLNPKAFAKYVKGYTPYYRFPSKGTVAFESDENKNSMAIKYLPPLPEEQIEVDNDRARWPCFFPSSAGIITSYNDAGVPNIMPCGSTTVVSRHPLIIAIALSNAPINERYAPRASLEMIIKTKKFGCAVPYIDEKILDAIRYTGNVSFKADPSKSFNSGLNYTETTANTPVYSNFPLHMDCEVIDKKHLGTHTLFFGEVKKVLVRKDVTPDNPLKWIPWADIAKAQL